MSSMSPTNSTGSQVHWACTVTLSSWVSGDVDSFHLFVFHSNILFSKEYRSINFSTIQCRSSSLQPLQKTYKKKIVIYNETVRWLLFIKKFHNHAQWLNMKDSGESLDNQTWHTNGWLQQNVSKVWFSCSHNCTLASGAFFHSVCQVWLSSGQNFTLWLLCTIVKLTY